MIKLKGIDTLLSKLDAHNKSEAFVKAADAYVKGGVSAMSKEDIDTTQDLDLQVTPCGDCTMCCTAPAIPEYEISEHDHAFTPKPACSSCVSLMNGKCGRYDTRPSICQGYLCFYSLGISDTSPVEKDVCWSILPIGDSVAVNGHTSDVDVAIKNPKVTDEIFQILNTGAFSAVILRDDKKAVGFDGTNGEVTQAEIDPRDPMAMSLLEPSARVIGHLQTS